MACALLLACGYFVIFSLVSAMAVLLNIWDLKESDLPILCRLSFGGNRSDRGCRPGFIFLKLVSALVLIYLCFLGINFLVIEFSNYEVSFKCLFGHLNCLPAFNPCEKFKHVDAGTLVILNSLLVPQGFVMSEGRLMPLSPNASALAADNVTDRTADKLDKLDIDRTPTAASPPSNTSMASAEGDTEQNSAAVNKTWAVRMIQIREKQEKEEGVKIDKEG